MGPDGGYRLGAGTTLPPLLLDDNEAAARPAPPQTIQPRPCADDLWVTTSASGPGRVSRRQHKCHPSAKIIEKPPSGLTWRDMSILRDLRFLGCLTVTSPKISLRSPAFPCSTRPAVQSLTCKCLFAVIVSVGHTPDMALRGPLRPSSTHLTPDCSFGPGPAIAGLQHIRERACLAA